MISRELTYKQLLSERLFLNIENNRIETLLSSVTRSLSEKQAELNSALGSSANSKSVESQDDDCNLDESGNWYIPSARVLDGYKNWLVHEINSGAENFQSDSSRIQIALIFSGGLGDALQSSAFVPHLCLEYDGEVTYVTDSGVASDVFKANPYVTRVVKTKVNPVDLARDALRHNTIFDLIVIWRYGVTYILPAGSRLKTKFKVLVSDTVLEKYYTFSEVWPMWNRGLTRDMVSRGHDIVSLTMQSSGMSERSGRSTDIPFFPTLRALEKIAPMLKGKYITIHHGFDPNYKNQIKNELQYRGTKNLSIKQWADIVAEIKGLGINVVQLGSVGEDELPGVDLYLNGMTSVEETSILLKYALSHIDTEGGLVHLSRSVHGRSIVMFGPTPVDIFGYPQNINLNLSGCNSCWYSTSSWVVECPRKTAGPECMSIYTAEPIVQIVKQFLSDETAVIFEHSGHLPTFDNETLKLLLNEISGGKASVSPSKSVVLRDDKYQQIATALINGEYASVTEYQTYLGQVDDTTTTKRNTRNKRVGFASPINLPYEESALSLVILASDVWKDKQAMHVLNELCRVIESDGLLVILADEFHSSVIKAIQSSNDFDISVADDLASARAIILRVRKVRKEVTTPLVVNAAPLNSVYMPNVSFPPDYEILRTECITLSDSCAEKVSRIHSMLEKRELIENKLWVKRDQSEDSFFRDGWINVSANAHSGYVQRFLLEGWHDLEDWGVWGKDTPHQLLLVTDSDKTEQDLVVEFEIAIPFLEQRKSAVIFLSVNDKPLGAYTFKYRKGNITEIQSELVRTLIPAEYLRHRSIAALTFSVEEAVSPSAFGSDDRRLIGVGLKRFRFGAAPQMSAKPVGIGTILKRLLAG